MGFRAVFLGCLFLSLTAVGADDAWTAKRAAAVARPRAFVYNTDGCDMLHWPTGMPVTVGNFTGRRLRDALGTRIGTVSYCPQSAGFGHFTCRRAGEPLTASVPKPGFRNAAADFFALGTDALQMATAFCATNGLEAFVSIRVNDQHDAWLTEDGKVSPLFPPFKYRHPECLMGAIDRDDPRNRGLFSRDATWSCVNFAEPAVREHMKKFVRELVTNYDVDGVEYDFNRHFMLFRSVALGGRATKEELATMTALMRELKAITEEVGRRKNRPIVIAVRAPDSVEYDLAAGVDLETWFGEKLVDLWIGGGYFRCNPWKTSVDLARRYGIRFYASLDESRIEWATRRKQLPVVSGRDSAACYAGRISAALAAGCDGVYVFNIENKFLREVSAIDPQTAPEKLYFAVDCGSGGYSSECWVKGGSRFNRLPTLDPGGNVAPGNPWGEGDVRRMKGGETYAFDIELGDDFADHPNVTAEVLTNLDGGELKLTVNGCDFRQAYSAHGLFRFEVPYQVLHAGANAVAVTFPGRVPEKATLNDFAVRVRKAALLPSKAADAHAPETWFHVIGGNASKEGIVADLDAIAAAGIGGIQFFHGHADGRDWPGVIKPIPCLSADWEDLVRFTSEECHKRGLTFKMQNCPGWSMSGGPWVTPDKAMRKLVAYEPGRKPAFGKDDDYREIGEVTFDRPDDSRDAELVRVYPNPQQLCHAWAYEPQTNLNGRACPPGAWQDSAPMTFAGRGASRLDMWEAKAGWGLRKFTMSTNAEPVRTVGKKTLVFGHVNAKIRNHPAPPEGTGWECDKMDPRGFEANWNGYLGKLLKAGVKIDGTLVDSWECGVQSWTWKMEEEFERRNGYKLRPWLPALFGHVLKSEVETEKFLLDWRNTCSRLIEENYFGTIARLAHEHGMTAQYETAFGDVIVGDILRYWKYADEPMCEFWSPHDDAKGFVGSHNFKPVLPCVSAAHVYGKKRVSAEALTSFELTFDENFKDWKKIVDRHLGRGVTHIVFHTYTHNPVVNGKPPSTSFGGAIGSPFLRKQSWWPYLKGFTKYLATCGRELERGKPVVDILMYLGDDVNHKPPERELLFDNRYKYDYCNQDALLTRLSAKDGRLVLPDGMSYRVLWIPKGTFLLPATKAKLELLVRQGARIVRGDFTPDWPSPLKALVGLDGKDVHWYQRRDGDEDVFFVSETNGMSCFFYCKAGQPVRMVNPVSGQAEDVPSSGLALSVAETRASEPWATRREYVGTFDVPAAVEGFVLSLGDVRDWATVWVNGKEVAQLWCEPYACDLTSFIKPGRNDLRIEVVSTWYNTLVHEAAMPHPRRTTWTKCGPKATAPLRPVGLLGPVQLSHRSNFK